MKCLYSDIGCFYIDDVTHDCEAPSKSCCPHEPQNNEKKEKEDSNGSDDD